MISVIVPKPTDRILSGIMLQTKKADKVIVVNYEGEMLDAKELDTKYFIAKYNKGFVSLTPKGEILNDFDLYQKIIEEFCSHSTYIALATIPWWQDYLKEMVEALEEFPFIAVSYCDSNINKRAPYHAVSLDRGMIPNLGDIVIKKSCVKFEPMFMPMSNSPMADFIHNIKQENLLVHVPKELTNES